MDLFDEDMAPPLTRDAGLAHLKTFLPLAGRHYAAERNFDKGRMAQRSVSCLSPYLRRRLLTESEILQAVLTRHDFSASEKFISEIFWRTYFKGWLELRPSIWTGWLAELETQPHSSIYQAACQGKTDIACFNDWVDELRTTGYLHNHARMWFASIWIFTLKLPWQWGARFFMNWLKDGDPASNTLSWRWVAGLHSRGKHYLAKADNIERFTQNRFAPYGQLDEAALPIIGPEHPPAIQPDWPAMAEKTPYLLVVHGEDCAVENLALPGPPEAIIQLPAQMGNMQLADGSWLRDRRIDEVDEQALEDAAERASTHFNCKLRTLCLPAQAHTSSKDMQQHCAEQLVGIAKDYGVRQIYMAYLPVGIWQMNINACIKQTQIEGLRTDLILRPYDKMCWPHARRGFFPFKEHIPKWLKQIQS